MARAKHFYLHTYILIILLKDKSPYCHKRTLFSPQMFRGSFSKKSADWNASYLEFARGRTNGFLFSNSRDRLDNPLYFFFF